MKIIGLTGPIASGKNEVARILQKQDASIIDADELAHTLYKRDKSLRKKIIKTFGTINRKKLGEIVFGNKPKLKLLNKIVHPYLSKIIRQKAQGKRPFDRAQGEPEAKGTMVINAAVLKEIGLVNFVDEVWVVMAPRKTRLQRLLKSGISKKDAEARLRSQMSQKEYLKIADLVIENNSDLKALKGKVLNYLN
jgi:dephospho-CoA kinase